MDRIISKNDKDSEKIAKGTALAAASHILFILLAFSVNIIITRSIGPESYGIIVTAMTIVSLAEIIALFGMEDTMIRFIARYRSLEDYARLKGTLFFGGALVLSASVIVTFFLFMASNVITDELLGKPHLQWPLKVLLLSVPFNTLTLFLLACLQGAKLIQYRLLVERVQRPLMRILAVCIVVFLMGEGLRGIVWAYLLVSIAGFIMATVYFFRYFNGENMKSSPLREIRKILSFSSPLLLTRIFNRIIASADILILGYYLPLAQVGIYGVATRLIPLIAMPLNAVNMTFAPLISDLHAQDLKDSLEYQFKMTTRHIVMASLPVCLLIVIFSEQILGIFGREFVAGQNVLFILCLGQIINAATGSVGYMLVMTGRPNANLINTAIFSVINVLLNLYLIPLYGLIGAAFANAISTASIQFLRLMEVWFFLGIHPYSKDTLKPVLGCLISALFIYFMKSTVNMDGNYLMSAGFVIAFIASYAALLYVFKISPEDMALVRRFKAKIAL